MVLPEQYAWFEPILILAIIVFVICWIGNALTFGNRFVNALVTSIIFALVFGAVAYFGYGNLQLSLSTTPAADAPAVTSPLGSQ